MAVDAIVRQIFDSYSGSKSLPKDPSQLDELVKYTVGRLAYEKSGQSKRVLEDVGPNISARYLVGALADTNSRDSAKEILIDYGASYETVMPLVGALANPEQRDIAKEILMFYGPSDVTARAVVGALNSPKRKDRAREILIDYGASNVTVRPLVGALADTNSRDSAKEVFMDYGASNVTVKFLVLGLYNPKRREIISKVLIDYGHKAIRHINKYLAGKQRPEIIQSQLEIILEDIKAA